MGSKKLRNVWREIPYRRVQQLGPDGLLLTDGTDVPPEEPEPSPTPPAS